MVSDKNSYKQIIKATSLFGGVQFFNILISIIKSKVVALDDVDQNRWIPAIHKDWSGAIPATIIYNSTKRKFYEQSFTQAELESELKQFLKK